MASDLRVNLETALPASLRAGSVTALFCCGTCFHRRQAISGLELLVNDVSHPPAALGMPRPDLFAELHPGLRPGPNGEPDHDPGSAEDPELRCFRSGFWGTLPVTVPEGPGELRLDLRAALADGAIETATLGAIPVSHVLGPDAAPTGPGPAIAICMATFDPDPELFRRQVVSLREQSERDWLCLVSDDCSSPERFEAIVAEIGSDARFEISRSQQRLGFYRNFERALGMAPRSAELVALCDQDDRWHPEKLATLRAAIGDAQLVYSDARLVDAGGRLIADTVWEGRRNNHTSLASLLITNTVTGAASMFRREVMDRALPFPEGPGWQFHDHWLGVVALAGGNVAYVSRPLYDYVQHRGAVLRGLVGDAEADAQARPRRRPGRAALRAALARWRERYFYGYLPLQLRAQVLLGRCSPGIASRKARVLRRIAAADRSPAAFAWLGARRARMLLGHTETQGAETVLISGIAWRHLAGLCARGRRRLGRPFCDAAMPGFDPDSLAPKRWRRRQAAVTRRKLRRREAQGQG